MTLFNYLASQIGTEHFLLSIVLFVFDFLLSIVF